MASSASQGSSRDSRTVGRARRRTATKAKADSENVAAQADSGSSQRRRRSEDPGRQRDPARTRQLILDAAAEEFGNFGYDGARVMRIAEGAGVAHQLITYHFGGKKGLFEALSDQWVTTSAGLAKHDKTLVNTLPGLVRYASTDRSLVRAVIREGQGKDHADLVERLAPLLAIAREFQERGEIDPDLDSGIVTLVLIAANFAPTALPHLTRAFSKVDPSDPKFVDYYAEQLSQIAKHLAAH